MTLIKKYIQNKSDGDKPLFLLILWPSWVGKTSFLIQYAKELLWSFYASDFLWIKDYSQEIGKQHTIPVERPPKQKTIEIDEKEIFYENKGVREINEWLQQSSFSGKKILFIENIKRMSKSAMNAFLKNAEEPLKNRIIFATANQSTDILDTLVSRAFVVSFTTLSEQEINWFIDSQWLDFWNEERKKIAILMANWRVGTLLELQNLFIKNPELGWKIIELDKLITLPGNTQKKIQVLKDLQENWVFELFIDMQINKKDQISWYNPEKWIHVKRMISANVSLENALRYWVL